MASYVLTVLAAAASVGLAATPPGFQPGSQTELVVSYGSLTIDGQPVPKMSVQSQPMIGTQQKLKGTSFAVIMVDLDIPTNTPPQTTTLLHWMQMGLTQSPTSTKMGDQSVFMFMNMSNTPPAAAYIGPSPPARIPLSHRYTQILVDTSGFQTEGTNALLTAAMTRQGFNVEEVLSQVGLQGKVVAGNFFNVTNPGPVNDTGISSTPSNPTGATGTLSFPKPTATIPFVGAGSMTSSPQLALLAGLALLAAMFL